MIENVCKQLDIPLSVGESLSSIQFNWDDTLHRSMASLEKDNVFFFIEVNYQEALGYWTVSGRGNSTVYENVDTSFSSIRHSSREEAKFAAKLAAFKMIDCVNQYVKENGV